MNIFQKSQESTYPHKQIYIDCRISCCELFSRCPSHLLDQRLYIPHHFYPLARHRTTNQRRFCGPVAQRSICNLRRIHLQDNLLSYIVAESIQYCLCMENNVKVHCNVQNNEWLALWTCTQSTRVLFPA